MDDTYICETCGKQYNVMNKIAHQIFCQNKDRVRSFSNIKNKEPEDNVEKNDQEKKENLQRVRPKSRIQLKRNIHTLFSYKEDDDIQKEEKKIDNLNLIKLKPKIIENKRDYNNLESIFKNEKYEKYNLFKNNEQMNPVNLLNQKDNKRIYLKRNNNINIQLKEKKQNNINLNPSKNNNFIISKNNNIMINNKYNIISISGDNNIIIKANNNNNININKNKEEEIKKDEEFAMQLMKEELQRVEKEKIERKKKEEEYSAINEIKIKSLLEEDIEQIEENKRKLEEQRRMEEDRRRMEEQRRRMEEDRRRMEEQIRRSMEEVRRRIEEQRRIFEEEQVRRINEENWRRDDENWRRINQNNYNNLIESKIKADKLNEENKQCVICIEDFKDNDDAIFLPCFHFFHSKCIKEWLNKTDNCPLCKINVKNNLNNNL